MPRTRTRKYWNYWKEMVSASVGKNTIEIPEFLAIADFEGKKVLDAGAGVGRVAFKISGLAKSITCVDESKPALNSLSAEAKRQNLAKKIHARIGDLKKLPFKNNSFDIVYALWVIHNYKKDWQKILKELNRVLKRNGCLIVCFSGGNSELAKLEAISRKDLKERKEFKTRVSRFLKKINGNSFGKSVLLPFVFKTPEWAFKVFSETFFPKPLPVLEARKSLDFLRNHSSVNGCIVRQECVFCWSFKKTR